MEFFRKIGVRVLCRKSSKSKMVSGNFIRQMESFAAELGSPLKQSPSTSGGSSGFGFLFDIDGVITRGRTLLPHSVKAFKHLTSNDGKFLVPTIFVTNSSSSMRESKAKQLSEWLDVEVSPEQIVMAYSPLKMFTQFHNQHVLVTGQGPTKDIAKHLGFTNITTLDTLHDCFPLLDTVDHCRRKAAPCAFEKYFPKINAVLLLGEPNRWEVGLQLLLDVLMSNGHPYDVPATLPYPHLPVLACNMDLCWMSEAPMPRFGHGCFLRCLETLYQRLTGHELKYTALVGKPSEITYHYAERVLQRQARKMGLPSVQRMYCIGDNPDSDIFGANLFNRYLQRNQRRQSDISNKMIDYDRELSMELLGSNHVGVSSCDSLLVCTGIFDKSRNHSNMAANIHGDFVMDSSLCVPSISTVHNVLEAVLTVFDKEIYLKKQRR